MMHGSFVNRMMDGQQYGELSVGMGATKLSYSDREAYTVQRVVSENRVIVTRDKVTRTDNNHASDMQDYEYESTPLVEGKLEKACTNWYIAQLTTDGKDKADVCNHVSEHGTCEGCMFWKLHKPTNGVTVIRTKDGRWKQMGADVYFALGVRDEYYDYSF